MFPSKLVSNGTYIYNRRVLIRVHVKNINKI